jgi:hypothetical protein
MTTRMTTRGATVHPPEPAATRTFNRGAAVTRSLLGYGVIVGPIYLVTGVGQGLVRDGFSFARHPLSVLANGAGGWVQTTNFVVSGLMVLAAAIGMWRVLRPTGRACSVALGVYGVAMLSAAVLKADAMDGFPIGTPLGPPTSISPIGLGHFIAGALGFVAFAVSALLAARVMQTRRERTMARLSLGSGLVILLGFFGGFAVPALAKGSLGIWTAVVVGWAWLAALSVHLYRVSPDPNCAP